MVRFAWNLGRGGTKKSTRYQVLYPVENPPKVRRTELYRAVPYSEKAPYDCVVGEQGYHLLNVSEEYKVLA